MKTIFRVLRALLVTIIVVPLALPVLLFVALSFDSVQSAIADRAERELTALLGSPVEIGDVDFGLFNRIVLNNVSVSDSTEAPVLTVGQLGAGLSLSESLWHGRPVISYAELIDVGMHLRRDSAGAPLNIEPILARFKKKEKKEPSSFDLSVNMVVVRRSSLTYDILDRPAPADGRFDPSHIAVSDIRADLEAPRLSDSIFEIEVKRMGAFERSGLTLSLLSASLQMNRTDAMIDNLVIEMPHSRLAFDNITIPSPLTSPISALQTHIATLPDTHVSTSDLRPLLPTGFNADAVIDLELDAEGSANYIDIGRLNIAVRDSETFLSTHGDISGAAYGRDSLSFYLPRLSLNMDVPATLRLMQSFGPKAVPLTQKLAPLSNLGRVNLLASVEGDARSIDFDGSIVTACGNIDLDASVSRRSPSAPLVIEGNADIISFDPSTLDHSVARLTDVNMHLRADMTVSRSKSLNGVAEVIIPSVTWKGLQYNDISAEARFVPGHVDFQADSRSPQLDLAIIGGHDLGREMPATELFADLRNIDLSTFLTKGKFAESSVSATIDASAVGIKPDDLAGWLSVANLTLRQPDGSEIDAGNINLEIMPSDSLRYISLDSDPLAVKLDGKFTFASLAADMKGIASRLFPSLVPAGPVAAELNSTARLTADIKPDSLLSRLFKLPVEIITPVTLRAALEGSSLSLNLDAQYLRKKDQVIENTGLTLNADAMTGRSTLTAKSNVPTKKDRMQVDILATGGNDTINTQVRWKVDRKEDFHGLLSLSAGFNRPEETGKLETHVDVHPTQLVFNDSAWNVTRAAVDIKPGLITVADLGATRRGQALAINGTASADSLSRVVIDLEKIDLDYIFETLAIDNVMFGGIATGRVFGDALLSPDPVLYTPRLHVDNLAYNNCVMGDGDIRSWWDNNTKTITIKADILGKQGEKSIVDGYIRPTTEELVFNFTADRAPVGFMLPFMSAFTSSISGSVSGEAKLYGTFKDLDLKGRIYADNLRMKLDFTNTTYTVSDSVRIDPGHISFNDVTLTDRDGHTAKLSGEVRHRYFHDPTFLFDITGAKDLLVYDIAESETDDPWYGRIYGRGGAKVVGVPGRIDIGVTMATEPNSTFTFVLSDSEESVDYNFITFHDRDKARKDSLAALDPTPQIVRELRARANRTVEGEPSQYVMDFNVDISPEATLNLIMDPVGGDKIVAHGSGHLNMKYDSQGELEMRGEYRLNRGFYSFTLQDIIVKNFTIRDGSSIRFSGDPYAAQLDITAAYSTTANLTDLDQSFQSDPELNRTNVKVNALMKVKGDMRSPEIGYDLEFPSLTSDIDRKVKSIVSTEEMMSQQIIYLLALNRFYTPEYMSATHGNELVSVASSTLSSRISSMLGALSDDWSIAPAIRSSKGDFSDVEFDLALSSQLLDNRLLLNGNFGYRDKSLNNNSFIGDFDIRYLLNRAGTIQLKAYNRYNDQNYYLKSALTTQGIGVVFKRDFDNVFSFLKPLLRKIEGKKEKTDTVPADTIPTPPTPPAPSSEEE